MAASVEYNGALRCTSIHVQSNSILECDALTDNRGQVGWFSITDLTCTSLSVHPLTTMAIQATDRCIGLKGEAAMVYKFLSKKPGGELCPKPHR